MADIGCDHGKLSAYLICKGICQRVIAADLRPGPLSVAEQNCQQAGCADRIDFRLGNGLEVVEPYEADTVVLAGISAQTIIEILQMAPWVKNSQVRLVFVPATKPELLRRWLWNNGFSIGQERVVKAAGRWYAVFSAEYEENVYQPTELDCVLGKLPERQDVPEYRAQVAIRLAKVRKGLESDSQAAEQMDALLQELNQ